MVRERVLGIDPGTRNAGWAVLDEHANGRTEYLGSGAIRAGTGLQPIGSRLSCLHDKVAELICEWQPTVVALESAFFGRNARSVLRLGEARGAVIVAAGSLPLVEIPPALVKRRIAGRGGASKNEVARMVGLRLGKAEPFATEDESDAVAVALTAILEKEQERLLAAAKGGAE